MIDITSEDSNIIKANLGERVSKIVIEAAYTVMDTANDFPSSRVTASLVPAAKALIELAKENQNKVFQPETRILLCLTEAESILRSTRQRVAGLPVTREFSRLPFELPPPCVHLFHEACEHIVNNLLRIFDSEKYSIFYPYVTVDTVDGSKHSIFSIRMPEHRLYSSSIYTALSHESFHAFFKKNDKSIYESDTVKAFVESGYLISQNTNQHERTEFIEELIVELLDFEFSYLHNFKHYLKNLSPFFADFLKESIKGSISINDIANYVFRTFVVKIWDHIRMKAEPLISKPSEIAEAPSALRAILRDHIKNFKAELSNHHEEVSNLLFDNLVVEFQRDFEAISNCLNDLFRYVLDIVDEKKAVLEEMESEIQSKSFLTLSKAISAAKVCNKSVRYPHLLTLEVARLVRESRLKKTEEKAVTVALILSLWNSMNICNYRD